MVRGIEGGNIFSSDGDRDHFISRLGHVLQETKTICYAWALIPNHFHLLLRSGPVPISTTMRRLLTGYAVWYNRRHRRQGHLFQNRFKSILCQEDVYLMELVRYIHLNPIRAGIVRDMGELGRYPYGGHSVLMGKVKREWQETAGVLGLFGEKAASSRRAYAEFVEKGIGQGKRPDLSGGGLIRGAGGVDSVLAAAEEAMEKRYALRARGYDLEKVASRVSEVLGAGAVWTKGKYRHAVEARSLFCYWAVSELGTPMSLLGRKFGISIPAVSKSVARGRTIAETKGYSLVQS